MIWKEIQENEKKYTRKQRSKKMGRNTGRTIEKQEIKKTKQEIQRNTRNIKKYICIAWNMEIWKKYGSKYNVMERNTRKWEKKKYREIQEMQGNTYVQHGVIYQLPKEAISQQIPG